MRPTCSALLRQSKTPAFLVTEPLNIRYLTGIYRDAGVLLATPSKLLLFADPRFHSGVERQVRKGIVVRDAAELPRFLRKVRRCGFEANRVDVGRLESWERSFPSVTFVPRMDVVESFRRQKEADELAALRRARRITKIILQRVPSALYPGVRERDLARTMKVWALELGADDLSFDPIVAFGSNTSSPHHVPTLRALRRGHLVQIDVGARVDGYCGDMSAVYCTGTLTAEQRRVLAVLKSVQRRAMHAAHAGVTTHALDRLARDLLREKGIEEAFCHSLGHGVGLEIHEGVTLSQKRKEEQLLRNEVITIEPGVYFPGKWGLRVEDMVFVR